MAVNKFDQPIDAQFINTYVPIPFQEMVQAGALKQDRYQQAATAADQTLAAIENVNAIPNSVDASLRDQAVRSIYSIRDKYATKDLSDPMVVRQMNNEIMSAVKPSDIRKWEESHLGYQNYMQESARMEAAGRGTPEELRFNFNNYDSSVTGVFNQLPRMGHNIKKATKEFFDDVQRTYLGEQVMGDSGVIGYAHGVTENRLLEHAARNLGVFADSPAGRQILDVAKARGDDRPAEEILYGYLASEAPEFVERVVQPLPGQGVGRGNKIPNPKSFRTPGPEVNIANMKMGDVLSKIKQDAIVIDQQKEKLENLIESNASPEEIEAARSQLGQLQEDHAIMLDKQKAIESEVEEEYGSDYEEKRNAYVEDLESTGMSESEARNWLKKAEDLQAARDFKQEDSEYKTAAGGNVKWAIQLDPGFSKLDFKKQRPIIKYLRAAKKIGGDKNEVLRERYKQEFSETDTAGEIKFSQNKITNKYYEFRDMYGDMQESLVHSQFTLPIMSNPERWTLRVEGNEKLDNRKDLDEYIRLAKEEGSGVSLELSGVREIGNEFGGVNLYYTLSGPKLPGTDSENKSVQITAVVKDPRQIKNLTKQLMMMGDVEAFSSISSRELYPLALERGKGEYTIQRINPETGEAFDQKVDVTWDSNTLEYVIQAGNREIRDEIKTKHDLGGALVKLQAYFLNKAIAGGI